MGSCTFCSYGYLASYVLKSDTGTPHGDMEALYHIRTHPGRAHSAVAPRYKGKDFPHKDEDTELMEGDAYDILGYSFPTWKKWMILSVMFYIQIAINLNASLYANGVKAISKKFGISEQAARVPQLTFLCAYAFGCELWAPWSEELGRWPTQQLSLFLVNIWQLPCAFAPNFGTRKLSIVFSGLKRTFTTLS